MILFVRRSWLRKKVPPNLFINEESITKIRIEWEGHISQAEIIAEWATSNFSYIFGNL
jgi:hypothetical protein